mgnify:CR=1 FL=1
MLNPTAGATPNTHRVVSNLLDPPGDLPVLDVGAGVIFRLSGDTEFNVGYARTLWGRNTALVDALSLTAEETSSSMNEMDVSIDQVQSNANETARLSEQVARDAEIGADDQPWVTERPRLLGYPSWRGDAIGAPGA